MKKLIIISILALLTAATSTSQAKNYPDEYLGLPGDNFNLYATMKLFQESETLEDFERSLNDENSYINNLDLNGDNLVDYIMVVDYVDGNVHTIVLRTALNQHETQDIAVFTVERYSNGSVRVQLIGDEMLYGRNYIVEPVYADSMETPNPAYIGNSGNNGRPSVVAVTTYEVAAWPVIRFIYRPGYVRWYSSWHWGYYPSYWNPWRPLYYHTYYGYHSHFHHHYYTHYRHWNHHRYHRYNDHYYSNIRTYSPRVTTRIKEGNYKKTYSRPDLRRKGEVLYTRSTRNNTNSRSSYSGRRNDSRNSSTVKNSSINRNDSSSERRSVSNSSNRTRTNQAVGRSTENARKSTTIQPKRSVSSPASVKGTSVNRRTNTTNAPARVNSNSSSRKSSAVSPKSTTVTKSRTIKSSAPKQSSPKVQRSSTRAPKTKSATRSVSSKSSSRSTRSAVSTGSSSSRSSGASSRSSSSRSSSNGSPSRR
ncbi:hypothetical protein [Sunxiuqinia dokdonensis]|uniref:DUF3300 domain-containing protein n=1 Tax=Sunxiuqinia dokdonensis TaxID=1409788 RepID=A0A0L8V8I0_9BACT|nr:hypothetical protein [Sunxiuqinia dokdonensis]KOH44749.1 hypothetical protein NC99_24090 [Sunxiuqinia dokdonensis]